MTGLFEAEVVNRGGTPTINVRFHTASGEYIADPGVGTAQLPEHATLFVDTTEASRRSRSRSSSTASRRATTGAEVTTPATGSITITVTARDGAGHDTSRTFTASRRAAGVSSGSGDGEVTVTPTRQDTHRIVREAVSPTTVTVRLEPRASVTWTWPGGSHTGETAEIPATSAAPVVVTATFAAAERRPRTATSCSITPGPRKATTTP